MKSSINVVVVSGNLVASPELQNGNGTDYVRFRIGSNRRWTDGTGEAQERTDFFDVVTFGGSARGLAHAIKGTEVVIEGRLQLNEWTNGDGQKRQRVEIVAETVHFVRKPRASRDSDTE